MLKTIARDAVRPGNRRHPNGASVGFHVALAHGVFLLFTYGILSGRAVLPLWGVNPIDRLRHWSPVRQRRTKSCAGASLGSPRQDKMRRFQTFVERSPRPKIVYHAAAKGAPVTEWVRRPRRNFKVAAIRRPTGLPWVTCGPDDTSRALVPRRASKSVARIASPHPRQARKLLCNQ